MSFSNEQIAAIQHVNGPALVLAGPGSGKTTVITHRIMHLLSLGVPPDKILVITFTKDAATEMEARFKKLLTENPRKSQKNTSGVPIISAAGSLSERSVSEESGSQVTFGTFHSIFFYILRLRYNLSFKNIITDRNKTLLLRELTSREQIDSSYDTDFFRLFLSEISKYKSMGEESSSFRSKLIDNDKFLRILSSYQSELKAQRLLDFDDMLLLCHKLFVNEPEEKKLWQSKFSFILVDEFQDINPVQYSIIRMLAEPENNLFIVGDDDQSIYRFRGAEPSIMLGFEKDYPKARRILLSNNYRSQSEIVSFARNVVSHNKQRFPKDIKAAKGPGAVTLYYRSDTTASEYAQVLRNIKKELNSGVPLKEIAILFRTETIIRPLLSELNRMEIPFVLKNKVKNIYESSTAEDIISYIRLSENMGTRADFLRIMNKPLRYISRTAVSERDMSFEKLKKYYSRSLKMQNTIDLFLQDLRTIRKLPTFAAMIYIRKRMGYESYLEDYSKENHVNIKKLHDIMDEMEESAKSFPDKKEWLHYVESYGEDLKNDKSEAADGLRLMTFHSSKGLEFDIVHLVDINEGIVPYSKAVTPEDLEEERRAFYVALTRARKEFHIYFTEQRYSKHCSPSRFILEGLKEK
ncbi:ATP-dependent helicase [Oribacterium sp. P6A1]|uniref:ATP-dependent helicase n=1 Tax=Oribacterium sp. P6A1 TaxID=1410612 RepID=UPI0005662615|nr:ATP-dependent helicase [Oribacterium sp. P6A1]